MIHNEGKLNLSVLQKFETFFEKIPHDSSIAFINQETLSTFVPLFVKALLRYLGRKTPVDAEFDSDIVQTWLSNNEARRDLVASSSTLYNMKTDFIISLSKGQMFARNATSQYSYIGLPPTSSSIELEAMKFLSSEKNKQSDETYLMHRKNLELYLKKK